MELSERKRRILKAIINAYIDTAEPIGSKSLLRREELEFSSATLRNEMAELEDLGLLYQPYVSAGRVPSKEGFRFYIDCLMPQYVITKAEKQYINNIVASEMVRPDQLIVRAAMIMAEITGYTAVNVTPSAENDIIKHFECVPVSDRCAALMIVTGTGMIKSVMFMLSDDASADDYMKLNKILYNRLTGVNINDVGDIRLCMIENDVAKYCSAFRGISKKVADFISEINGADIFISGENKALSFPEFYDINKARAFFSFLQKHDMLKKMLSNTDNDSINIILGDESGVEELSDISFITSGYNIGGRNGTLAIIGPMRLNYSKAVSDIKYFTDLLSKLINDTLNNTEE